MTPHRQFSFNPEPIGDGEYAFHCVHASASQRNLQQTARGTRRLGPDILADPPDFAAMIANLRRQHPARELGDALLDQRLVAGIGNMWAAEALWEARLSPWSRLARLL